MMRVAITAAAVRTALGHSADEWLQALRDGRSAVGPIQGFDASGFGDVRAAQIWKEPEAPEDDPALRILGPHGRLLDGVAREAYEAAGLASFAREDIGLFVGMGMVDSPIDDLKAAALASRGGGEAMDMASFFAGTYRQIHPLWPLSMLNNVAAGQIAIDLDIRGDNTVFAADGTAGLRALLEAAWSVEEGTCRAALAAGVSGRISPAALARRALAPGAGEHAAEGGAAFVFESEASARARGTAILGYVVGGGTAFGGPEHIAAVDDGDSVRMPAIHGDFGAGDAALSLAFQLACWRHAGPDAGERTPRRCRIDATGPGGHGILVLEEAA